MIRRIVRQTILSIWPDAKNLRVLACGYALPYMRPYLKESERVLVQLPASMQAHRWPEDAKNLVMLSTSGDLPIETNSIDRLLVMHGLEFSDHPAESFAEYGRILKSTGRMMVIVPNRLGLWARIDWTPLGYGTPFSVQQVKKFLRDQGFVIERSQGALFAPPLGRGILLNAADFFEKTGRILYPGLGGLHVIEVSKQVYALTGKGEKSRADLKPRLAVRPEPAPRHSLK